MKTICIVTCGIKKIWDKYPEAGPTPAKDVYIGVFARKCQEYAQAFYPDSYYILSAKYGFLKPSEIVPGAYNVTFRDSKTKPISIPELRSASREKGLFNVDRVVVVAGSAYARIIRNVFPGKEIIEPLKGCAGIGIMMSRLNQAIREGQSIS
jgi:hypothetical protein